MLNALKKLINGNDVNIVKRGRGRYIQFHSYKIFESGKIETIDGKPYTPVIIDGKAYLTLQFSRETLGNAKIEIARIVYSYLVKPIDIIDVTEDSPEIVYLNGDGTNFRLDNLRLSSNVTSRIESEALEETTKEELENIQQVVNELNTSEVEEVMEQNEKVDTEEKLVDNTIEEKIELPKLADNEDSEELIEMMANIMDKDINEVETLVEEDTTKVEEEIETLSDESEEYNMDNQIPKVIPEENLDASYSIEKMTEINKEAMELVKSNFNKNIIEKIDKLSSALSESEALRDREKITYSNALNKKDTDIQELVKTVEALKNLNSELNDVNKKLNDERIDLNNRCYIIKKEDFQRMYATFNKVLSMAKDLK